MTDDLVALAGDEAEDRIRGAPEDSHETGLIGSIECQAVHAVDRGMFVGGLASNR